MNLHALVLCGGGSRRMGRDKAWLDWRGEPMLARVVRLLGEALPTGRVVCVAAGGQSLPPLPAGVRVVHDRQADCGPLEGLTSGLNELHEADAVFVTTCDAPLLVPGLPVHMASLLGDFDAVVPRIAGQLYPLTAVYRPQVTELADRRIQQERLRVIDFVGELHAQYVDEQLRGIDPELLSVRNCNSMDEYEALLELGEQG